MTSADWLRDWPGIRVNEPLARHSQYGIGGPADFYRDVGDVGELAELLRRSHESAISVTVLGAGSNTLILDGGIRGLVLRLTQRRLQQVNDAATELSAGYMMPRAALDLAKQGIAGLEFGIGVPGTTGASVFGNAGAFGSEIGHCLIECDALSPRGEMLTLSNQECGFHYRDSRFKRDLRGHIVIAARFRTQADDPAAVRARTDAIQAQRKAEQPYGVRSLGSVFKNPPGDHAGRLVEACGLKGARIGGAEISPKHANFVTNVDSATAAEVLALVDMAQWTVRERFGVELEREIIVAGEPTTIAVPR